MVDQAVAMLEELAGTNRAPATATSRLPPTRRVLYNLDGDSCMWTKKDGKQPVTVTADDMKTLIDEIAYPGSQVDTFLLCTNAQVTYYPSKIGDRRGTLTPPAERAKWPAWEQQLFANVQAMFAQGVDPYALLLAEARRRGLESLLTYRMNDIHDFECLRCKFWLEHPEYRLPDHVPGSKYFQPGVRAGFDFAHQAVRDYTFRLIEEAVQRYDCDGIELDFVRAPIFFQNGTEAERIAMMNELVERVRQMLDAEGKKRGRHLVLAARVLADDAGMPRVRPRSGSLGQRGLDRFPHRFALLGHAFRSVRQALERTDQRTFRSTPVPTRPAPAANYRLAAENFRKEGADGIYLFNFFTPREVFVEPPFEVLKDLGDPP